MKFAFYGSLRAGHYNHERHIANSTGPVFEGTEEITGYKMYETNYHYPYIVKTGDPNDRITVEFYELDPHISNVIHYMELGAGYHLEEVERNGNKYRLYAYKDVVGRQNREVIGGDWTKHMLKQ